MNLNNLKSNKFLKSKVYLQFLPLKTCFDGRMVLLNFTHSLIIKALVLNQTLLGFKKVQGKIFFWALVISLKKVPSFSITSKKLQFL